MTSVKKNLTSVLFAAVGALSLAACADTETTPVATAPAAPAPVAAPAPADVTLAVLVDGKTIQTSKVKWAAGLTAQKAMDLGLQAPPKPTYRGVVNKKTKTLTLTSVLGRAQQPGKTWLACVAAPGDSLRPLTGSVTTASLSAGDTLVLSLAKKAPKQKTAVCPVL